MEEILDRIISILVNLVEASSAGVIILGTAQALWGFLRSFIGRVWLRRTSVIRLRLGQNLVLALEFQVAADILKTALSPTWNDILLLVALIALRTGLNYVLEIEMRNLSSEARALATEERLEAEEGE